MIAKTVSVKFVMYVCMCMCVVYVHMFIVSVHVLWVYVWGGHSVSVCACVLACVYTCNIWYLIQISLHPSGSPGEPHIYSANSAKDRLQLFIQWWVEYSSNYDKLCPWLKGAASQLEQLVAREESTLLLSRAAANCQGMCAMWPYCQLTNWESMCYISIVLRLLWKPSTCYSHLHKVDLCMAKLWSNWIDLLKGPG